MLTAHRFDTLVAELADWRDGALMSRVWGSSGGSSGVSSATSSRAAEAEESLRRVWWRKPDCLRDEVFSGSDLLAVNVCRGAAASSYSPGLGVLRVGVPTIEAELAQITLLRPPFRHEGWEIAVTAGERRLAGRPVVAIEAWRASPGAPGADPYWDGFDLFTALIDAERGLPLRIAAIVDGEEAARSVVRSVRFDEPIPDEVFDFAPPAGTTVVRVRGADG